MTSQQKIISNILFFAFCGGLLLFLLSAPEETTPRLPQDTDHKQYHLMDKKEAEKFCDPCHTAEDAVKPLPEGHPPKYRCIFCHKQER